MENAERSLISWLQHSLLSYTEHTVHSVKLFLCRRPLLGLRQSKSWKGVFIKTKQRPKPDPLEEGGVSSVETWLTHRGLQCLCMGPWSFSPSFSFLSRGDMAIGLIVLFHEEARLLVPLFYHGEPWHSLVLLFSFIGSCGICPIILSYGVESHTEMWSSDGTCQ